MKWRFTIFEVLVLIGIVQGAVIAGLIWLHKIRNLNKLLLSFVIVVFNCLCIKILIHTTGLWQTQAFRYLPLAFDLAIQPLLWLYTLSLTQPGLKLSKKHALHFIPFAISLAYSIGVYIVVLPVKDLAAKDVIANRLYFNEVKETEDILSIVLALVYWVLSLRLVVRYRRWLNNNISDTGYPIYSWLKNTLFLLGVLIAALAVSIILDRFFQYGGRYFIHWQLFFGYLSLLIYYLGFRGYLLQDKQMTVLAQAPIADSTLPDVTEELPVDVTVKGMQLTEDKSKRAHHAILEALEARKLYLDPELSVQKLAKEVNMPVAIVSAVINHSFRKTFRNLINDYRVEEVKARLRDPRSSRFSILGIAYECGFNSEASFYRIFKASVGVSPKEYFHQQFPDA